MARYHVTVRNGPKVSRRDADTLEAALELVEAGGREAQSGPGRSAVDLRVRRFEPVEQVAARIELRGPRARAGVDVRGDGSAEAWTGRLRRVVIAAEPGEDAYAALRRALAG